MLLAPLFFAAMKTFPLSFTSIAQDMIVAAPLIAAAAVQVRVSPVTAEE